MLVFKLVMGSIAGISLLVRGIGIMILLASVFQRTREIGVRRAARCTNSVASEKAVHYTIARA